MKFCDLVGDYLRPKTIHSPKLTVGPLQMMVSTRNLLFHVVYFIWSSLWRHFFKLGSWFKFLLSKLFQVHTTQIVLAINQSIKATNHVNANSANGRPNHGADRLDVNAASASAWLLVWQRSKPVVEILPTSWRLTALDMHRVTIRHIIGGGGREGEGRAEGEAQSQGEGYGGGGGEQFPRIFYT